MKTREGRLKMRTRGLGVGLAAAIAGFVLPAGAALANGGPIMPLSQVQPGMNCTAETVVQGTTISTFNVHVIDVVLAPGEGPRILISASGPAVDSTGIAEGFSGSPVYCQDSMGTMRNAGAISEGVGDYGNHLALVTPIEQMLGEPVNPPAGAPRLAARTRELVGPLTVGGLSPVMLRVLQQAGQRVGREVVGAPSDPLGSFPVQPLVPGASVAVSYSSGAVEMGAIGTVTYRDGQTVYAFGHPFDDAGRRSLLLQDGYVYDVINDPNADFGGSYKLAVPGHTEGTLTSDTPNAVIGAVGAPPGLIRVDVTARDGDTGHVIEEDSQVADETDVGFPLGSSLLDLVAPAAVGQAAIDVYDGTPANESGHMCFQLAIRELRRPLQFCNRYVGTAPTGILAVSPPEVANGAATDVSTALALLDSEQFAQLHVTRVQATIDAVRGLQQATIVAAHAPMRVRAGQRVTVRLVLRRYRGALQSLSLRLRIPRHTHGLLLASIDGPGAQSGVPGGSHLLIGSLSVALGGGPPPPGPSINSIAALRNAFASIPTYDGLRVAFGRHKPQRAYRDPGLLITGRAHLLFIVRKR
jgi:hypothetical protein